MALTAEQRADISRQNGSQSRGPTSEAGKSRSRRNALKHGLRAEALALPNEDPAAVAARSDAWNDYYRPQSPAAQHLVNACVAATLLSDRCQKYHAAALAKQMRDAEAAWEADRVTQVAALIDLFQTDPAEAVRGLLQSGHGCRWVIGRWEALIRTIESGSYWKNAEIQEAIRLFGYRAEGHHLKTCPDAWVIRFLALTCIPNVARASLDWIFDERHRPAQYRDVYGPAALPTPEDSRRELLAACGDELAHARELEAAHRADRDDPERAEAAACALILHDGPSARLFLRYHSEARTSFNRAYNSLVKTLELDAAGACDAETEAETAPVHSPNEPAAATPAAAEAVSPNEPDPGVNPGETETSADPDAPARGVEPRNRKGRKVRVKEEEPVGTILLRLPAEEAQAHPSVASVS